MRGKLSVGEKRKALRAFKQRGYVVHVGALEVIVDSFRSSQYDDLPSFLDKIFELFAQPGVTEDGILTKDVAQHLAQRVSQDEARRDGDVTAAFTVLNIFDVPTWRPSGDSRMSSTIAGGKVCPATGGIAGNPLSKAEVFRTRFELMRNKTLRNPRFTPPASGLLSNSSKSPYLQLTSIESLAGTHDDRLVLGMLTQLEEGSWYLEDIHGSIKADLSNAHVTAGFHTECSFVIAHGRYVETDADEAIFEVSAMGTPPLEKREDSLIALGKDSNLFGGHLDSSEIPHLLSMETEAADAMILLISDVHLDSPRVMAGLRHVLDGYLEDDVVPTVVVLMGSFLSHPFGQHPNDLELLTRKFTELGEMIVSEFSVVAEASAFVIIPSLNEPGPGNVLPRPPMPSMITEGFTNILGPEKVHLATNPCRMRYMTQEFVIMREDLMHKMVRHCCIKPDMGQSNLMSEHLIKSVIDQAHLSPLPLTARPTIWNRDSSLWLYPTPHLVVIADKVDCYVCKYGGALGLNPGSFAADFSFAVYLPAERRAQKCSIDSEQAPTEEKQQDGVMPSANSVEQSSSPHQSRVDIEMSDEPHKSRHDGSAERFDAAYSHDKPGTLEERSVGVEEVQDDDDDSSLSNSLGEDSDYDTDDNSLDLVNHEDDPNVPLPDELDEGVKSDKEQDSKEAANFPRTT